MTRLGSLLVCAALCLMAMGCGSLVHKSSGDVLDRLRTSRHVDRDDRTVCQHTTPEPLISGPQPAVLATDRSNYKEVTDAMRARGLEEALKFDPKLSANASVILCLLDARSIPAAHATHITMAVAGDSSWVADGDFR